MPERIAVLVNPAAGRGLGKRLLEKLRSRFSYLDDSQIFATRRAGDEAQLAAEAVARESTVLVVAGGDGTCSRVANVLIASHSRCALAVIACGTGNDFAKTLGVDDLTVAEAISLAEQTAPQSIDVGQVADQYFLNSCGFGFDASVLQASSKVSRLRGKSVYIYSALKQLFTYRGVDVSLDDDRTRKRILMAIVSNGRYLGGAFKIAPQGLVTDGLLDMNVFDDCGAIERARLFASAMKGSHVANRRVRYHRAARFTLEFTAPPTMEVDGELRQASKCTVEIDCVPRALRVIAAQGFPR